MYVCCTSMHITSKLLINNTSSYYTYQLVLREHTYYDSYSTTIDTYYILLLQYQRVHTLASMHYYLHIHRVWIIRVRVAKCALSMHIILYAQMLCAYTLQAGTLASTLVLQYSLVASPVCILCIQHTPTRLVLRYAYNTALLRARMHNNTSQYAYCELVAYSCTMHIMHSTYA